tara:strand:+ start:981 stop:1205 length:225 start_codon:yes stop_codon:yes gene_type:complete
MSGLKDMIYRYNMQRKQAPVVVHGSYDNQVVIYYNSSPQPRTQSNPMVTSIGVHEFPHEGFGNATMHSYNQVYR